MPNALIAFAAMAAGSAATIGVAVSRITNSKCFMSFGFHPLPLNLCPSLRSRQLVCAGQAIKQFFLKKGARECPARPRSFVVEMKLDKNRTTKQKRTQ